MDSDRIRKLSDMKTGNMLYLLEEFLQHEEISRIEIAALSKCDNTTVTRAIRELLHRDLLITSGKREAAQGRPREMLRVNPDGRYLLGISLVPGKIVGVACDFRSGIRQRQEVILPDRASLEDWLASLEKITASLLKFAGNRLAGMGLAVVGTFACKDMALHNLVGKPNQSGFNLHEFFATKFGQNPMVFNLISCLHRQAINNNPALKQGVLMLVSAGWGIGMSIAHSGKIYLDDGHEGGEFGHNISELDGLPCPCGRCGCLETRASIGSILKAVRERLQQPQLTVPELLEMAQADDPRVRDILVTAARFLGTALGNQVNNLLPNNLLLTGLCLKLGQRYLRVLQESINAVLFPAAAERLKLTLQTVTDDAPAVGAAMQVVAELLADIQLFNQACPVSKAKVRCARRH
jgi:N-acetylglucosamine repressor